MINFVVAVIVAGIVGAALLYIRKEKKKGVTCIGCPDGCNCAAKNGIVSGCCCGGCSGH